MQTRVPNRLQLGMPFHISTNDCNEQVHVAAVSGSWVRRQEVHWCTANVLLTFMINIKPQTSLHVALWCLKSLGFLEVLLFTHCTNTKDFNSFCDNYNTSPVIPCISWMTVLASTESKGTLAYKTKQWWWRWPAKVYRRLLKPPWKMFRWWQSFVKSCIPLNIGPGGKWKHQNQSSHKQLQVVRIPETSTLGAGIQRSVWDFPKKLGIEQQRQYIDKNGLPALLFINIIFNINIIFHVRPCISSLVVFNAVGLANSCSWSKV